MGEKILNDDISAKIEDSVETGSGQPGHIFSGSSRSDPVYKLSGSYPDWITCEASSFDDVETYTLVA